VGPDLSLETRKRVDLLFRSEEREQAASLLVNECETNVRAAVDLAKLDFQDLLMAAGFPEPKDHETWMPGKKW
jgi:hypothetical protein